MHPVPYYGVKEGGTHAKDRAAGTGSRGGNIRKRFFRQQLCWRKFLDQFAKCLSDLSPIHANAFTLREIEGADTGEICKVLNVSETNLWVILHRARMQLRRCLETRWFNRGTEKEP
jgi:RNA polymerase sigma-70 factor (ECF subfamily)